MRRFMLGFITGLVATVTLAAAAAEISGHGILAGWVIMNANLDIICNAPVVDRTRKIIFCLTP